MLVFEGDRADGFTLTLQSDPTIFDPDADFSYEKVADRCRELAFLRPGLRIQVVDMRPQQEREEMFVAPAGLGDYVHFLNRSRKPLHRDVIVLDGADKGVSFQVGLQWTQSDDCILRSYVNCYMTRHGGTHLDSLLKAVTRSIRKYGREFGVLRKELLSRHHCSAGLTAVLTVELSEPQFEGPTRSRLDNPEVQPLIASTLNQWFAAFLECEESSAITIARQALAAHQAEEAAKQARRQQRAQRAPRRGRT
jgi:DNA gyrase subunit B